MTKGIERFITNVKNKWNIIIGKSMMEKYRAKILNYKAKSENEKWKLEKR